MALVLAGGKGSRLAPLTDARSAPAVPFAGQYRLIDVVLSNLANAGLRDVWIVEQYRLFTLNQHVAASRPWDLDGTRHASELTIVTTEVLKDPRRYDVVQSERSQDEDELNTSRDTRYDYKPDSPDWDEPCPPFRSATMGPCL